MKAIRIRGWDKHYENNRSRELKRPEWLPLPNSFDGRGFMELMDHPAGMSHYGAWCLLLGAASRMPTRGLLLSDSGHPLSLKDVARMTRGSLKGFEEAMPRLLAIGWVEHVEVEEDAQVVEAAADGEVVSPEESGRHGSQDAETSQPGAVIPQLGANKCPLKGKGNMNVNKEVEVEAPCPGARNPPPPPMGGMKPGSRTHALLLGFGLRATPETVAEWAALARKRARCATDEDVLAFIGWAIKRGKIDGVAIQYAREAAIYADEWSRRGQ